MNTIKCGSGDAEEARRQAPGSWRLAPGLKFKQEKISMKPLSLLRFLSISLLIMGLVSVAIPTSSEAQASHEVWFLDQSNTYDSDANGTLDSGGTLYIIDGSKLAGAAASKAPSQVIPLGGAIAEWVRARTGTVPVRAHYLAFNKSGTHAIVSFVTTGHVLIFDARTRTPVFVVDVGAQAHAAVPTPDETYILVANQNGKLLQRINSNFKTGTFVLDPTRTLNLATGTTPSGALKQDDGVTQTNVRPDNAPILALPDSDSRLAYVTLRGGGLFVVDATATPMQIVAEFTVSAIDPAGLLALQTGEKLFFNSGGGGGAALGHQSVLYTIPTGGFSSAPSVTPDSPFPVTVFDHQSRGEVDSHGLALTKDERFLWVADRSANSVIVVDSGSNAIVNEIQLVGAASNDPAPDLMEFAPAGNRVYVTLRGPNPLTGNNPVVNNARGSTPGLGVIRVEGNGKQGVLQSVFRVSNIDAGGVERADPHGLAVRVFKGK